jgi:carboxylesterase
MNNVKEIALEKFFPGGETGILCIHGYTGHPGDFEYIAPYLNEKGYTVSVPRLPGHGTSGDDFLSTGWKDWLSEVRRAASELKTKTKTMYIFGFSMGGLLSTIIADEFESEKMVLAAPAYKLVSKLAPFAPLIGMVKKKVPRDNPDTYDREDMMQLKNEYWLYDWPSQMKHLFKLRRIAKKSLKNLHKRQARILTIVSENDETVPYTVAEYLEKKIHQEKVVCLKNSPHVLINDLDKEEVAQHVEEFLKG